MSENPALQIANKIELHLKLDETPGYILTAEDQRIIVDCLRWAATHDCAALAAQQDGAPALPHKESIAREIRRAMLDNPTDAGFNARAEKREKIADATADVILGLFSRLEQKLST